MAIKKKITVAIGAIAGGTAIFLGIVVFAYTPAPGQLEIDFFDIGQGDAILIQTPSHNTILIDGGRDAVVSQKIAEELPLFQHSIDMIIATHPDLDHIGGLADVVRRFTVGTILMPDVPRDVPAYQELVRRAAAQNIPLRSVYRGDTIQIAPHLSLDVLAPEKGSESEGDLNNSSIVVRMIYNKRTFLFTGDAEAESEQQMIARGNILASDILKAGHHGSKSSSSEEFLSAVHPRATVISAGVDNSYGHPHRETMERFAKQKIAVYRTDTQGDIEVLSDGEFITITTEK